MGTVAAGFKLLALAALAMVALVGTACAGSGDVSSSNEAAPGRLTPSWQVPVEGLPDWVAYADQVSIISIISHEQIAPPPEVLDRGEGHIAGMLTVRVDETLWAAPGVAPTTGTLSFVSIGWTLNDGVLTSLNPDIVLGGQYLVALGRFESGLSPIRPPTIRVVEGRLEMGSASSDFSFGWMEDHAGKTVDEMKSVLETTPIDAVVLQFADLDVVARVAAVQASRRSSESESQKD